MAFFIDDLLMGQDRTGIGRAQKRVEKWPPGGAGRHSSALPPHEGAAGATPDSCRIPDVFAFVFLPGTMSP
jgi:hypothetical protein